MDWPNATVTVRVPFSWDDEVEVRESQVTMPQLAALVAAHIKVDVVDGRVVLRTEVLADVLRSMWLDVPNKEGSSGG